MWEVVGPEMGPKLFANLTTTPLLSLFSTRSLYTPSLCSRRILNDAKNTEKELASLPLISYTISTNKVIISSLCTSAPLNSSHNRSRHPIRSQYDVPVCTILLLGCIGLRRRRTSRTTDLGRRQRITAPQYPLLGSTTGSLESRRYTYHRIRLPQSQHDRVLQFTWITVLVLQVIHYTRLAPIPSLLASGRRAVSASPAWCHKSLAVSAPHCNKCWWAHIRIIIGSTVFLCSQAKRCKIWQIGLFISIWI